MTTKSKRPARRAYQNGEPGPSMNLTVVGGVLALMVIGMLVGVLVMQMMGGTFTAGRATAGSNIQQAQQQAQATQAAQTAENSATPRIDLGTAKQQFDANTAVMVDARNTGEFEQNHIAGAINIPMFDVQQKLALLPADKSAAIITYCS